MGLIQTAMLTGGGLYAVNKIAKATESRHPINTNYNNSGGIYQQQHQGGFVPIPQSSRRYIQQSPYYASNQDRYIEQPREYTPNQGIPSDDLVARERDLAMRERNFQLQMLQQQQQGWYPADSMSQQNPGYSQTPPPYAQHDYYGRQDSSRNGLQDTVVGLAGQFFGGQQEKK